MKLSERQVSELVRTADLLDKRGLEKLADSVDQLLKEAADPEVEKPEIEEAVNTEEIESPEMSKMTSIEGLLKKFIAKFYKTLLDAHTRFTRLVNQKELGYIGDEKREVIRMSFDTLLEAIRVELQRAQIEIVSTVEAKVIDNKKMIKDVYRVFMPVLSLYDEFERFLGVNPEFAEKFPRTKTAFLNLRNVLNNIIKSIPEEILDIELVK